MFLHRVAAAFSRVFGKRDRLEWLSPEEAVARFAPARLVQQLKAAKTQRIQLGHAEAQAASNFDESFSGPPRGREPGNAAAAFLGVAQDSARRTVEQTRRELESSAQAEVAYRRKIAATLEQRLRDGSLIAEGLRRGARLHERIPASAWSALRLHPEAGEAVGGGLSYSHLRIAVGPVDSRAN